MGYFAFQCISSSYYLILTLSSGIMQACFHILHGLIQHNVPTPVSNASTQRVSFIELKLFIIIVEIVFYFAKGDEMDTLCS